MKYTNVIFSLLCGLGGAFAGYYYGKKKEIKAYEADIISLKEEYQKKIEEARSAGRREAITMLEDGPEDGEKQTLTSNGDVDDHDSIRVVQESEATEHAFEDVVYFAKDNVWYNQDTEKTYSNKEPFAIPKDLFTYFGEDKADLLYLYNEDEDQYYGLRYNPGSYVTNVLGYDDTDDSSGNK